MFSLQAFARHAMFVAIVGSASLTHAQSNVTVYGILDAGVTRVDNVAGKPLVLLDNGIMQASRLGFRGNEDLGGGLKAVFVLEQGLNVDTGTLGQGGLGWGRQAYVGLGDARLGTVTLGRQYDFMFDALVPYINSTMSGGGYANNPLDNDRMSGQRVNNSIKYMSARMAGFSFGGLVALSEAANGGISGPGFTRSFGANYNAGDLSLGAAYTYIQGATLDIRSLTSSASSVVVGGNYHRTYGFGGNYKFNNTVTVHAVANESKFDGVAAAAKAKFRNYDVGVVYRPNEWSLGLAYGYTKLNSNSYKQLDMTADYFFSKRSDGYLQAIYQTANGDNARANIFILPGSSDKNQLALRVGLRHRF